MYKKANNLINEKSPYLLQHAYNPVDWFPWGDEVFSRALTEDKPVFLSIGYSTCHWCHVMEKESFEDVRVAKLLNDTFYCIKVDREERPDIDKVYMEYCQALTGSGGWPLTIIMTPDKKPFFAGTYIPKYNKYGRTGMIELIPRIRDLWLNRRGEITESSKNITKLFSEKDISREGRALDSSIFALAFEHLAQLYDITNGGFGTSPKFPTIHHIYFLLRYWKRTKNEYALKMAEKTLMAMRSGGIWDHIGLGFHRYSTDERWIVPHFEKMLYDQALISIACIETYQITKDETYKKIAQDIFTHVLHDMTSPEGGFYSALDADSEGVEGKFYTWDKNEIKKIFPGKSSDIIIDFYNIGKSDLESGSVLYTGRSGEDMASTASKYGMSLQEFDKFIESSRKKLFSEREKRIHPFKDDKILTDWNGLMIAALSKGGIVFNNMEYTETAASAADFIISKLTGPDGSLLHRYRDRQSGIPANLDDYAFFIMGLLELYESGFDIEYLKKAIEYNKYLADNFWDERNGGFYFTTANTDLPGPRQKNVYDGAIPSGNSIALFNLIKLARITGDQSLEDKANKLAVAFSGTIVKAPQAYTQFISSFDFAQGPFYEVVIAGDPGSKETKKVLNSIVSVFIPNRVLLLKNPGGKGTGISRIAPYTKDMQMINNKPTIYICSGYSCKSPTNDLNEALRMLSS